MVYSLISSFFQSRSPPTYSAIEPDYTTIADQLTHPMLDPLENNIQVKQQKKSFFIHLNFMNQSYFEHWKQSIRYCYMATKSSWCFFIHAFYPDWFQHTGSDIIIEMTDEILEKYTDSINRLDV